MGTDGTETIAGPLMIGSRAVRDGITARPGSSLAFDRTPRSSSLMEARGLLLSCSVCVTADASFRVEKASIELATELALTGLGDMISGTGFSLWIGSLRGTLNFCADILPKLGTLCFCTFEYTPAFLAI